MAGGAVRAGVPDPARRPGRFHERAADPDVNGLPSPADAAGVAAATPGRAAADRRGATTTRRPASEQPPDAEEAARETCLRLLTSQPRTRRELAAALDCRGIPAAVAARVLSRFTDVGLIDDRAFAAAWVETRHAGRGLGRRALTAELRRRGVDEPTVTDAVRSLDPRTEIETARALVRRRLPSTARLGPDARLRRLAGLLARRGYPPELTARVLGEEVAGIDDAVLFDLLDHEDASADDDQV